MAQQEEKTATTPSIVEIRSRSPRSLQTRNTKNLSLNIRDKKVSGAELEDLDKIPSVITKPVVIGTTKHPMVSQPIRSHASIYSLPSGKKSGSASPIYTTNIYGSSANSNKIGRVHSMSLSLKTGELLPSLGARGRSQTISSALETSTPEVGRFNMDMDKKEWILPNKGEVDSEELLHPDVFKKNAYPNGPLLVVPPNVYLYSEPTLKEILQFDVVINVAKEVTNLGPMLPQKKAISYHHVNWSHNSKISVDLDRLTDIIHEATTQNKKVLVHCQCGVSRSASLIVAYIMRFFQMGLNDAYSHLKRIAKDTSPNMGLIFQLMEWNEQRTRITNDPQGSEHDLSNTNLSFGMVIPNASSSINDLTIGSPELTPRTPGDYFNKFSASSSSTSTSSSTFVGNQSNSKPVTISTNLCDYLPTTSAGPIATSTDDFWTQSL